MERAGEGGRQRGFFVSFGYTKDAEQECAAFHKRTRADHQAVDRAGDSRRGARAEDVKLGGAHGAMQMNTPRTLFQSLWDWNDKGDYSCYEGPYVNYLAWLLADYGPLRERWLLRRLLSEVAPELRLDGDAVSVQREFQRRDIIVYTSDWKLIIEAKLKAREHDRQACRYLVDIASPSQGRLIYLSPVGNWPESVPRGEARVNAMSYRQLCELIDAGLRAGDEQTERGRVFAQEFSDMLRLHWDRTRGHH